MYPRTVPVEHYSLAHLCQRSRYVRLFLEVRKGPGVFAKRRVLGPTRRRERDRSLLRSRSSLTGSPLRQWGSGSRACRQSARALDRPRCAVRSRAGAGICGKFSPGTGAGRWFGQALPGVVSSIQQPQNGNRSER